MIQHDLKTVVRYRLAITAVVRLLGLWLLVTRAMQQVGHAIVVLWNVYFTTPATGFSGGMFTEEPWMVMNLIQGGVYLVVGVWMLVMARRIAAWMVPIPKPSCPGCRYALAESNALVCPECGLDLSSLQSLTPDSQPRAE